MSSSSPHQDSCFIKDFSCNQNLNGGWNISSNSESFYMIKCLRRVYTKSRSHTHGKVQFSGNKWGELFKNDHCLIYFAKFSLLLQPPKPQSVQRFQSSAQQWQSESPQNRPFIYTEFCASVSLFMPCAGDGSMAPPQADGTASGIQPWCLFHGDTEQDCGTCCCLVFLVLLSQPWISDVLEVLPSGRVQPAPVNNQYFLIFWGNGPLKNL